MLFIACSIANARPVPWWSYDRLLKESSLVVIVEVVAVRDATPGDKLVPPNGLDEHVRGVITTFRILAVLRGEYAGKTIRLKHFLEVPVNDGYLGNGPQFVNFAAFVPRDADKESQCQFMLFLKSSADGEYDFVTGKMDPIFSVKQMRQVPMQWPDSDGDVKRGGE